MNKMLWGSISLRYEHTFNYAHSKCHKAERETGMTVSLLLLLHVNDLM